MHPQGTPGTVPHLSAQSLAEFVSMVRNPYGTPAFLTPPGPPAGLSGSAAPRPGGKPPARTTSGYSYATPQSFINLDPVAPSPLYDTTADPYAAAAVAAGAVAGAAPSYISPAAYAGALQHFFQDNPFAAQPPLGLAPRADRPAFAAPFDVTGGRGAGAADAAHAGNPFASDALLRSRTDPPFSLYPFDPSAFADRLALDAAAHASALQLSAALGLQASGLSPSLLAAAAGQMATPAGQKGAPRGNIDAVFVNPRGMGRPAAPPRTAAAPPPTSLAAAAAGPGDEAAATMPGSSNVAPPGMFLPGLQSGTVSNLSNLSILSNLSNLSGLSNLSNLQVLSESAEALAAFDDFGDEPVLKVASKSNIHALAGAIAKRMRAGGQVQMVAIGPDSVNQAMKAIAISRTYLEDDLLDVAVAPEFLRIPGKDPSQVQRSAIQFIVQSCACAEPKGVARDQKPTVDAETSQLKVAGSSTPSFTAGAIAKRIRLGARCAVVSMGADSINQAVKAVAIARTFLENDRLDITFRPKFIHVQVGEEQTRTGLEMVIQRKRL